MVDQLCCVLFYCFSEQKFMFKVETVRSKVPDRWTIANHYCYTIEHIVHHIARWNEQQIVKTNSIYCVWVLALAVSHLSLFSISHFQWKVKIVKSGQSTLKNVSNPLEYWIDKTVFNTKINLLFLLKNRFDYCESLMKKKYNFKRNFMENHFN